MRTITLLFLLLTSAFQLNAQEPESESTETPVEVVETPAAEDETAPEEPMFTNDAIVFGILMIILALIFFTSNLEHPGWKKFYTYVPALLLCYLIPSLLNSAGIISADFSNLYTVAKLYLLPASLLLLTLSIDFKGILGLGPKSIIMFLTATAGIIIGGPIAMLIVGGIDPDVVGGEGNNAVWRGLATLSGSWIGGGANQTAMLEVYEYNQERYGAMVAVDIVVANIWMAFLLYGAGRAAKIDKWLKADSSAITDLTKRVENYQASIKSIPTMADTMMILGLAFGGVAVAHLFADTFVDWLVESNPDMSDSVIASKFFWIVVMSTTIGLFLSNSKARKLEGKGASRLGSVFIYVLVATIGMKMDITKMLDNPGLFAVGMIWMIIHVALLLLVAKLIRAPFFFVAVGSKANIGGAASAPVVASAFHPSLASVGVLLAVLGYALGTYGAIACAELMRMVAP